MKEFVYQLPEQIKILDYSVYVLTILMGIFFVMISIKNFTNDPYMVADFERWQYPVWFRKLVAVWQFICGVFIVIIPLSYIPALFLIVLMIGAVYTHLKNDPPATAIAALVFLIILSCIFWYLKPIVVLSHS